jgi:asparagine synthetase B (glutamine-hydrolysing)
MCGIVGYIGNKPVYDILINGLKKLEYRGYDSSGIMIYNQKPLVKKAKGKVSDLEKLFINSADKQGHLGSDIQDGLLMALLTKLILIHTHQIQEKLRLFIME